VTSVVRREDVARAAAVAAQGVAGVARLSAGSGVEVSTPFAGGKVVGVRLTPTGAEVHVVVNGYDIGQVADDVLTAVSATLTAAGVPAVVDVVVADIESAPERRSD